MKDTLLGLAQTILSSMDSDEINSINDSVEAMQVARVIRSAYFDIVERANLPKHYSLVNLTASGDATKPVLMTLPSSVNSVIWLKYDKRLSTDTAAEMRPVAWLSVEDFFTRMHELDATDTNYGTFTLTTNGSTSTITYGKTVAPTYFTSFDDNTVLFDSYDATVDTTLQSTKTLAYCRLSIPFSMVDTFVPDLEDAQFPLLLNEAKSLAWAELKQAQHAKAEVNARRGWTHLKNSRTISQTKFVDTTPNYGRKNERCLLG